MTSARKAAIAAYKERKSIAGVFAIRCTATTETWVGQTPDLDKIQNRIWFTLRQGGHPCRSLQAAWTTQGADSFTFEACERLEEEESGYLREALLKECVMFWRAKLGAEAV